MKSGFFMTIGQKELFYETSGKLVTDNIARKFIEKIGEINDLSSDLINRCNHDEFTLKRIKKKIDKAILELVDTGKTKYYKVNTKSMTECIPLHDAECLIIF